MTERLPCEGKDCRELALPTTTEDLCLCETCKEKSKGDSDLPCSSLIGGIIGAPLALFALAVILSCWFYFFSDLFQSIRLPGQLVEHGVETEAVFWEIEVDRRVRGNKVNRRITYTRDLKARFFDHEKKLCQVSLEDAVGSLPFLDVMPVGQRFLIRFLPDDRFSFGFASRHDESAMADAVENAKNLPLVGNAIIRSDPIIMSKENTRGFAIVHISDEMLNQPWLKNPVLAAKTEQFGLHDQGRSHAFIGLTTSEFLGGMTGMENLHPEDSSAQDAFGVLNLVKSNDEVLLKLQSEAKGKSGRGYTITAIFGWKLSESESRTLTVDDVRSIEVEAR